MKEEFCLVVFCNLEKLHDECLCRMKVGFRLVVFCNLEHGKDGKVCSCLSALTTCRRHFSFHMNSSESLPS